MKHVLITGGCGFVGNAFAKRLAADGYDVMVVDNLVSTGSKERFDALTGCTRARLDIRTFVATTAMEFDLIIHCAAIVGGRLMIEGDPLAVAEDLEIDASFFRWIAKAKNEPQVIYFSSSAVYPIELQTKKFGVKLNETMTHFNGNRIGIPDFTYGWAKLTGEYLAKQAVDRYGANVVIYRPFSGYGEDQSFDYPFPSIIRRVVNGEDPITIWGSGDQCRDFIHIDDIVDCVLQTKNILKPGEVLNLGSGEPISFRDLVRKANSVVRPIYGELRAIKCDTTKPEGVFYRVADTYKLNQLYTPKVSLEEGIRRVAEHIRLTSKAA